MTNHEYLKQESPEWLADKLAEIMDCDCCPARTNDRVRRGCGTWHDTDANPPGHVAKQSGVVACDLAELMLKGGNEE